MHGWNTDFEGFTRIGSSSYHLVMKLVTFILFAALLALSLRAEEPAFASELFAKGTLLYTDDFDGEFNREFWEPRTKPEVR